MKNELYSDNLRKVFGNSGDGAGYSKEYGLYVADLLERLDYKSLGEIINCFYDARQRSSTIFFIGNGGSAATASHFAQDLAEIGKKLGTDGFKTLSLTDNVPFITAIANDHGYENIFTGQMSEVFKKGDVLVAISGSGNSPNIVKAAKHAKQSGGTVVGLCGFDGGQLAGLSDHVLHVKTERGEYGPVEDIHMILDHMITTYLCMKLCRKA